MKRFFLFLIFIGLCFGWTGGPDDFGHIFADVDEPEVSYLWFPTDSAEVISGWIGLPSEGTATRVFTPFPITFYGNSYDSFMVSTNGFITFSSGYPESSTNVELPTVYTPNNLVAAYWDKLAFGDDTRVFYETVGTAPNRKFIITWKNIYIFREFYVHGDYLTPNTFQIIFFEKPGETNIKIQYQEMGSLENPHGTSATVGIENVDGTDGLTYCHEDSIIFSEHAVYFTTGFYDNDIEVLSIYFPDTLLTSDAIIPFVELGNTGFETARDIWTDLIIFDSERDTVYTDSFYLDSLPTGRADTLEFGGWEPTLEMHPGECIISARANMPADENPWNDSLSNSFFLLAYDLEVKEILVNSVVFPGSFVDIAAIVRNNGGEDASFEFFGEILKDSIIIFRDSLSFELSSEEIGTLSLGSWIPDTGSYQLEFNVNTSNDQVRENDTLRKTIASYEHFGHGGPDAYGYEWFDSWYDPAFAYTPIDISDATIIGTFEGYEITTSIALPFEFPFYGDEYTTVYLSSNGFLSFSPLIYGAHTRNQEIPNPGMPDGIIAALWDGLYIYDPYGTFGVYTKSEEDRFHIIFSNVTFFSTPEYYITFEIVLYQSGDIVLNYEDIETPDTYHTMGRSATVGIENEDGDTGLQYLYNGSPPGNSIMNHTSITFTRTGAPPDTLPPVILPFVTADEIYLFDDSSSINLSARIYDIRSEVASESLYYSFDGEDFSKGADSFEEPDIYNFLIDGLDTNGTLSGEYYARDTEGNIARQTFEIEIIHPIEDTEPPNIYASIDDTLWLIPGSDGFTYVNAEITDTMGLIEYDSLYAITADSTSVFTNDSIVDGRFYHYSIGPFEAGEMVGLQFVAIDTAGNITEFPHAGHLDFVAWEQHLFGPLSSDFAQYWMLDDLYQPDDDSIMSVVPEYVWIEIDPDSGGRGVVIEEAHTDWLSEPIEFASLNFPYFDESEPRKRNIRISSNGFITFDTLYDGTMPAPEPLPSGAYPAYTMALYHADFEMDEQSRIIFQEDVIEQRIIVQWQNLAFDTGDTIIHSTFQAVLKCSEPVIGGFYNNIIYNYKRIHPQIIENISIGFQDSSGSKGIAYPTSQNPLAARMPVSESSIRIFNSSYEEIHEAKPVLPNHFYIAGAYPNPFNSTTNIEVYLPDANVIHLDIISTDGKSIENMELEGRKGKNTISWQASGIESGIYFAMITTNKKTESIKLLFVK
ncbi:MAG: T9SS type A sorting domain-containing protein [Candidatus Zixiibacteriota bacterium]